MSTLGAGLSILDWLKDKLPIQGRVERWKNERDNLKKEKAELEKINFDINKPEDRKKCDRLAYVNKRLPDIEQLLINKS